MAAKHGRTFQQPHPGAPVSGTLIGTANLGSGRSAMIDNGLGFSMVLWRPILAKRIGQHISGGVCDSGGIDWSFGRKRGLAL